MSCSPAQHGELPAAAAAAVAGARAAWGSGKGKAFLLPVGSAAPAAHMRTRPVLSTHKQKPSMRQTACAAEWALRASVACAWESWGLWAACGGQHWRWWVRRGGAGGPSMCAPPPQQRRRLNCRVSCCAGNADKVTIQPALPLAHTPACAACARFRSTLHMVGALRQSEQFGKRDDPMASLPALWA